MYIVINLIKRFNQVFSSSINTFGCNICNVSSTYTQKTVYTEVLNNKEMKG